MIGQDFPLLDLIRNLMNKGLEDTLSLFYGTYEARVSDNKDPQHRGRIKVVLESFSHTTEYGEWIRPAMRVGADHGQFWPPEEGDTVRVVFSAGDQNVPVAYFGGWFGTEEVPAEFAYSSDDRPVKRGFVTRMGHSFVFSDEPDNEYIRMTWHKADPDDEAVSDPSKTADREQGEWSYFEFEPDGSFIAANKNGTMIKFDASKPKQSLLMIDEHGNSSTFGEKGIKQIDKAGQIVELNADKKKINVVAKKSINAAAETVNLAAGSVNVGQNASMKAVLWEPLLAWLSVHTHPTGVGPSGPASAAPTGPPPPTIASTSVKLKL